MKIRKRTIGLALYFGLLLLPIYWMLNMSLRTNADILSVFSLYPTDITFGNYIKIFTDKSWYSGYINSIIYVPHGTGGRFSAAVFSTLFNFRFDRHPYRRGVSALPVQCAFGSVDIGRLYVRHTP